MLDIFITKPNILLKDSHTRKDYRASLKSTRTESPL